MDLGTGPILSSSARHLPLAVAIQEWGYVELHAPRFIRGIGQPSAIRGQLRAFRTVHLVCNGGLATRSGHVRYQKLITFTNQYTCRRATNPRRWLAKHCRFSSWYLIPVLTTTMGCL